MSDEAIPEGGRSGGFPGADRLAAPTGNMHLQPFS